MSNTMIIKLISIESKVIKRKIGEDDNKQNIKAPHYWFLLFIAQMDMKNRKRWNVMSSWIFFLGQVIQKCICCRDCYIYTI